MVRILGVDCYPRVFFLVSKNLGILWRNSQLFKKQLVRYLYVLYFTKLLFQKIHIVHVLYRLSVPSKYEDICDTISHRAAGIVKDR